MAAQRCSVPPKIAAGAVAKAVGIGFGAPPAG